MPTIKSILTDLLNKLDDTETTNKLQVDVVTAPTTNVTATDLDIRNLVAANDTVVVTGGVSQTSDIKVTLDGESITANAGTNLNTSALSLEVTQGDIKTAVETIAAAVDTEVQVDVVSGEVTANAGTDLNTSALALEATLQDVLTELETLNTSKTGFVSATGTIADDTPTEIIADSIGEYAEIASLSIQMADATPTAVTVTLKSDATSKWSLYLPATDGSLTAFTFDAPLSMGTNESVTLTSDGTTSFVYNVLYKMVAV